ncbi:MAG TPA: 4'-phosphopantetheinyl transferase superfamily protein [Solirubrobacteraceae bacterium]
MTTASILDLAVRPTRRVGVWWAPLDLRGPALHSVASCLSAEEQRHACRFHRTRDRTRFETARGWRRRLLARELGCAAAEVSIVTDAGGKPRVAGCDLHFSAARSGALAVYATSWDMDVGVDVEEIRPVDELRGIAARFFTRAEQHDLLSLPPAERLAALFDCWTHKEAYVKGTGAGLTSPIDTADVWRDGSHAVRVAGWSIHRIDLTGEYAAAVAGADAGGWFPSAPRRLNTTYDGGDGNDYAGDGSAVDQRMGRAGA